jgi:hypothetical protein
MPVTYDYAKIMQPYEVIYTKTGRKGKYVRNVIGVLFPTALALRMGWAEPIFKSLGDVDVAWEVPIDGKKQTMEVYEMPCCHARV